MAVESMNDKLSIKNLLFSKAIPNYVIPFPTTGHKVYSCTDCGDRFVFESSYEYHINRKSVQITYMCRHCGQVKIFKNRCNLLSHIRSHAFKTATINVSDLQVEPLLLNIPQGNVITAPPISSDTIISQTPQIDNPKKAKPNKGICIECKKDVTITGTLYKDRAKHCMQYTNEVHSCPVCLFVLPTTCGLKAHLRIHLKNPPYYCPECGIHLSNKSVNYSYNHDCEGFKMMRATARFKCPVTTCHIFHPNEYKTHMKENHLKKVYKCPLCVVACFSETTFEKHLKGHKTDFKALIFYQCELCPGRLVLQNQVDYHIKGHISGYVYPCWACGGIFKDVPTLISHHAKKHGKLSSILKKKSHTTILNTSEIQTEKSVMYRVVKRCDKCKRSFFYRCKYDQIHILPNECPYKCSSNTDSIKQNNSKNNDVNNHIKCRLCKNKISENWEDIKKHYAINHKAHRCIDVKVVLKKLNVNECTVKRRKVNNKCVNLSIKKKLVKRRKNLERKSKLIIDNHNDINLSKEVTTAENDQFVCNKCGYSCENKQLLETHIISHRDPCSAYQCMECGQCFVVKPSFATHLLLEHGISNADDYIKTKQCYNGNALIKHQYNNLVNEPLHKNQCKICREQFETSDNLEKHFRVHGMAFLMKNTSNKIISS